MINLLDKPEESRKDMNVVIESPIGMKNDLVDCEHISL